MNPGKLNKRIKVLEYLEDPDGAGGYLDNWETEEGWGPVATVWANIHPLRGREFNEAQQAQSEVTHKITIRYRNDINKSHIIVYNGRRLDIENIINVEERNKYLEIMCVERL